MLIVVHDRDIHFFTKLCLNLEALRRLNIFQVDGSEGWLKRFYDLDKFIRIFFGNFDIKAIDAGIFLKKHGLAFHHRFRSVRTYVAKS